MATKIIHFDELANHSTRKDCWILIHGKVYDLTTFLPDHPGGDEVLMGATAKDGTPYFEDVGHSPNAKELMKKYYIGDIDASTVPAGSKYNSVAPITPDKPAPGSGSGFPTILKFLLPLLILGIAFALGLFRKE
ncbi:hypothetical protein Tsubulata_014910 [Turnera subulata]|uniref:Cytochrome b5 heme-binding domain-containing protein n=1 Tax=Turnera subulata TaxID=218843 RepID=A0A9Q0JFD7_9ROSI|nr:hypothetical protein Tsubulata_014910 [Turnera subulata]